MPLEPIGRDRGDQVSEVYLGERSDSETQRVTRERVEWMCREAQGPCVLDVGCSQGMTSVLVARRGLRCVGVDIRRNGLAYAEKLRSKEDRCVQKCLGFMAASCFELPFNSNHFDSCLLGEVLEHIDCPGKCLAEIVRVLKPRGKVVITVPFGQLPHPDHKRVYYFSAFLEEVEPLFETVTIDLVDKRIRFVGRLRPSESCLDSSRADRSSLLNKTEAFLERLEELNEQNRSLLTSARLKYRRVVRQHKASKEGVQQLETELSAANEGRAQDEAVAVLLGRLWSAIAKRLRWVARDIKTRGICWFLARIIQKLRWSLIVLPVAHIRLLKEKQKLRKEEQRVCKEERAKEISVGILAERLERFLNIAKDVRSKRVVVIFSGTRDIKEIYGNRPMRQARVLLDSGVPVLFSYYRWNAADRLAESDHPLLLQSPIDLTMEFFDRIMKADLLGKEKIFVVSFAHPFMVRKLNELHAWGWRTIYDVRDNWEEFKKVGAATWYNKNVERYIVSNVEACCCVASPLQEKIQGFTTNKVVHLNPNAYDTRFLKAGHEGKTALRNGAKIAGYFGHLTPAWFDWKGLNAVARQLPDWTFEIVGRNAEGCGELAENISVFPPKSHAELNDMTQRWRVAMIPFKMGSLADGVDPIKIYEYLALGMPTVSFRMPQIHDYPYVLHVETTEAFAEKVVEASEMPLDRGVIDGFLSANTWQIRVNQMLGLLNDPAVRRCDLHLLYPGGGEAL